jgi:pyridoxal biosynthesis lyase PdxS
MQEGSGLSKADSTYRPMPSSSLRLISPHAVSIAKAVRSTLRTVSSSPFSAGRKTSGETDGTGNSKEASSHSKQIQEIISKYHQSKTK